MENDVLRSPTLWILVADAKQAQIYVPRFVTHHIPLSGNGMHRHMIDRREHELEPLLESPLSAESKSDYDAGRNQTGMVFESFSSARHMSSPHVDLREEIKDHFAHKIANFLAHPERFAAFDQLIIVAPPKMLGKIDGCLSEKIRHKIKQKLAKELTKESPKSLAEHLHGYF